jgi:hypothetical protein
MIAPKSPVSDSKDCFASKENPSQEIFTEGQAPSGELRPLVISEAELSRKVEEALRETNEKALCDLQVLSRLGVITLQGQVPTLFMKLLAIRTALTVIGSSCVVNCAGISVSSPDGRN